MPLLTTELLGVEQVWGLWHIAETEPDLSFLSFESCPEDVVHPLKRLEWLAGRALIKTLLEQCNISYQGLRKDEFRKPFLKLSSHQISLSHSYPYVAAQLDKHQSVGIDVEQPKEKLRQVASRVFSKKEATDAGDDLVKLCVYWCAKEALYKIYGRRNLLFTDHLQVMPFTLAAAGVLTGKIVIQKSETIIRLGYRIERDFVLVFTATTT